MENQPKKTTKKYLNRWFDVFFLSFSPLNPTHLTHKKSPSLSVSFFYYYHSVLSIHTWTHYPIHPKYRTRYAPTCRCTSVSWGTRTISGPFGWLTMRNSWRGDTCREVDRENTSPVLRLKINRNRRIRKVNRNHPRWLSWEPRFPPV